MALIEIATAPLTGTGEITVAEDPNLGDGNQNALSTIQFDQSLKVKYCITFNGALVGMLLGKWYYGVHFERIGPGQEVSSISNPIPTPAEELLSEETSYEIEIPAGHFDPYLLNGENVFRIVATATFRKVGSADAAIAICEDLGLFHIYQDNA